MNIHLTPQLEEMVRAQVATGRYTSASELVREALRLFEERQRLTDMRLADLRRDIEAALQESDRGEAMPFDRDAIEDIKRQGRRRLETEQGEFSELR